MGKMFKLFGIITVVAVIGFSFVSCGGTGSPAGGGNGGSTWDTALNGRWYEAGRGEYVFSNGNWEFWWVSSGTRAPSDRGTVTTSGNRMTLTVTHVSGTEVVATVPEARGHVNPNDWYSRSQLSSLATTIFGMATTDVERLLHQVFVSHNLTYSITNDGNTLFMTWPNNVTRTLTRIPLHDGDTVSWRSVSAGDGHTVAIRRDGSLWAWGRNSSGQLGDGTAIDRRTPVMIGAATDWAYVSAGFSHTVAIREGGTLWAWGSNWSGQLGIGIGTATGNHNPVRIP